MKLSFHPVFAGLFSCLLSSVLPAATEPGILWNIKNFDSTSGFQDIAANGSGRIVAVGDHGVVRVSDDHGTSWSTVHYDPRFDLRGVAWTGARWVAAGGAGDDFCAVMTSEDGENWTPHWLAGTPSASSVASSPEATVLVGRRYMAASSEDSTGWHVGYWGAFSSSFNAVVRAGAQWVAVGNGGRVETSPDGENWTRRTSGLSPGQNLRSVAWNGSVLVAAGLDATTTGLTVLTSSDGIDWSPPPGAAFSGIGAPTVEWTGSSFVVINSYHVFVSTDGTTWNSHDTPEYITVSGSCMDGGQLVAVSYEGQILRTSEAIPDETSDWTSIPVPYSISRFNALAEGDVSGVRRAVAVGAWNSILTSDNEFETSVFRTGDNNRELHGVAATNLPTTRFVVVGRNGFITTSTDGIHWTSRTSGTGNDLDAVAWFNQHNPSGLDTRFAVAVGAEGTILTSPDLVNWTARDSHTTLRFTGVAVGSVRVKPTGLVKRIVAVGYNDSSRGAILYSGDGAVWKEATLPDHATSLYAVAAGSTGFVAVGDYGTILTSPDGIHWSLRENPTSFRLKGISWTGSQFVAVGERGVVLTSPDAIHWTRRRGFGSIELNAVATLSSGRLAAVGDHQLIAVSDRSPDFADWVAAQALPPGQDGPDDDPNHDGISNLLAYALGLRGDLPPTALNFTALPRLAEPGPDGKVRMRFHPSGMPRPDIEYIVETSRTLAPGSWTEALRRPPGEPCGEGTLQITEDPDSGLLHLVFPESPGEHERFFTRLRVEQTP